MTSQPVEFRSGGGLEPCGFRFQRAVKFAAVIDHYFGGSMTGSVDVVHTTSRDNMYLVDENPTAENIARIIYEQASRMGMPVTEISLWETSTSCATYRPPVK